MFQDRDYKSLSKEELLERLNALRSSRKEAYTAPRKTMSRTKSLSIAGLENVNEEIAAKILKDLTALMEGDTNGEIQSQQD
jgi:hypothetical protein